MGLGPWALGLGAAPPCWIVSRAPGSNHFVKGTFEILVVMIDIECFVDSTDSHSSSKTS